MPKTTKTSKQKIDVAAQERKRYLLWSILTPLICVLIYSFWHYRTAIFYYNKALFSTDISTDKEKGRTKHDARNVFLMTEHDDKVFGIDVSQYQDKIIWQNVHTINERFVIDFVFVRATMGEQNVDKRFKENWEGVKEINKLRGAYHYFRPNENSTKQANNFIRVVKLNPGDLPPVLDIEEHPRNQSMENLKIGLKRWLTLIERHYKVKPILYSGDKYYTDFLEKEFSDYPLWIANYNFWTEDPKEHWDFWQFSEKGSVKGIKGYVDLNLYQHSIADLEALCVPYN
ncbi:glycoside hydrolase family 25 protein [Sphingobacterium rhinopitheci]|uniref:glycoside hydrolase family 25 protein n=1 Tax=Sphingobacterium rhinopitheci TaxID=2781960 RepID=UPI001F51725F|nr:glycoside hydrolase family 25 protein [Sphingobacterium rhinopitheci]MCI0922078.1 glycoside hydrolase family 25 protein [Sphingobacterium rhinopitheci]